MEPYKIRFIKEYTELNDRINKLDNMLNKWKEGSLDFDPDCPYDLLAAQLHAMQAYLEILKLRASIEKVEV
jgi:hypothetical protein